MAAIAQMKLLINLALIDGKIAETERQYIHNIGSANGFTDAEVEDLFGKRHALIVPEDLSDNQKFEYIFSLVQLMKADQRIYKEEIMFCSKIASRLGFDEEIMFDLMLHVKSMNMDHEDVNALKDVTMKYLIKD